MIQTTNSNGIEHGTAFSVDVESREYWITAKHLLTGAKHPPYGTYDRESASVAFLQPSLPEATWLPVTMNVLDVGQDIDIVVLAPPTSLLSRPIPSEPTSSAGAVIGASCAFLGFWGQTTIRTEFSDGNGVWMPWTKHCSISMFDKKTGIWFLDGANNPGFSGGPIVFNDGNTQKIMAVVSGIAQEPAEIVTITNGNVAQPVPNVVAHVNAGFLVGYDIKYAITAIHEHPIGPIRTDN